jgi:hypothetical protein
MSDIIYTEFLSKAKNLHYAKRYLRFISIFKDSGNVKHHILPKANDMWPRYADFKTHTWNCANLGFREHFVAHWILWKAVGGSQLYAFNSMRNKDRQKLNSTAHKTLMEDFAKFHPMKNPIIREQASQKSTATNKAVGTYIDTSNRFNTLDKDGVKWATTIAKKAKQGRLDKNPDTYSEAAVKIAKANTENGTYTKRASQLKASWEDSAYREATSNSMRATRNSEEYKERNIHTCQNCGKAVNGKGNLKQHERRCLNVVL